MPAAHPSPTPQATAASAPPLPGACAALPPCDTTRKFVRITERRNDGLVAFEFAIGWPDLAVDLLLPSAAFDDFCATQQVQMLAA